MESTPPSIQEAASLENADPMYYLIGFGIFLFLFYIIRTFCAKPEPEKEKKPDPRSIIFTRDDLRKYDGTGPDQRVYIACNGYVFDVTGSEHYTGEGSYAKFAGRDISMACANYSTDDMYLDQEYDPDTTILDVTKEQNILGFWQTFCQKYKIVGKVGKK
mmetsp:Transcript_41191/g.30290  ORF Transcript_41191/g.30290 Transcript_41191/m.30290 type:complete len:160 (-) Transcript_41191:28-507(-)